MTHAGSCMLAPEPPLQSTHGSQREHDREREQGVMLHCCVPQAPAKQVAGNIAKHCACSQAVCGKAHAGEACGTWQR